MISIVIYLIYLIHLIWSFPSVNYLGIVWGYFNNGNTKKPLGGTGGTWGNNEGRHERRGQQNDTRYQYHAAAGKSDEDRSILQATKVTRMNQQPVVCPCCCHQPRSNLQPNPIVWIQPAQLSLTTKHGLTLVWFPIPRDCVYRFVRHAV